MAEHQLYYVPISSLTHIPGSFGGITNPSMFPGDAYGLDASGDLGSTVSDNDTYFEDPDKLQLSGPVGTIIVSDDDDTFNDDVGLNVDTDGLGGADQELAEDAFGYSAGTKVQLQYGYILDGDDGSELTIYAVNFREGLLDNTVEGIVSNKPLDPNVTYTVRDVFSLTTPEYSSLEVCYESGTTLVTGTGLEQIQNIKPGNHVLTRDNGFVEVLAIEQSPAPEVAVCILKGALAEGVPSSSVYVTRNHRVLLSSPILKKMKGARENFVPAKYLEALPGVELAKTTSDFYHIVLKRHEVLCVHGAWMESFFAGDIALQNVSKETSDFITENKIKHKLARDELTRKQTESFLSRSKKNNKPVFVL